MPPRTTSRLFAYRKDFMKIRLIGMPATITALVLTTGLSAAYATPSPSPEEASSSSPAPEANTIVLARDQQPKPNRPTLDMLSQQAKQEGISLKQALDKYAADVVAKNPSVKRDMPDGPVPDPTIDVDGIPFAELIDLNQFATAKGISLEEAIDRYAWTPAFNKFSATLETSLPDDLAGMAIVDGGRGARVAFRGEIPQQAVELAKTLPVEVTLIGGKGFSEKEIKEVRHSSYTTLASRPEVADAVGEHNYETGVITLTAELKQKSTSRGMEEQVRAALRPASPSNPKIVIDLKLVDDLGIEPIDNYLRGGGYLEKDGQPICTSGFNAISDSGEKQAITARHCASDAYQYLWYKNHPDYHTAGTTVGRAGRGDKYDLARYSGGSLTHTRTFYWADNTPRYVTARGTSPRVNQLICSFGRSTALVNSGHPRCGEVTNIVESTAGPNSLVTDYAMLKGDSGGPSYYGSTAWGINSGVTSSSTYLANVEGYSKAAPAGLGTTWNLWICASC